MDKPGSPEKSEGTVTSELEVVECDRKRSKSLDSRGSSISSEVDSENLKGARRKSKESTIHEEKIVNERISKAIEEEDAFLDFIKHLPAMSEEKVEAYKKSQTMVLKTSKSEAAGGLDHLDNLYKLMEHLGQLRIQNTKLQERVKYLENIAQEEVSVSQKVEQETGSEDSKQHSRSKRSTKCKSSHYGIRQTFLKSSRERSRSVGVEEILKSTSQYRLAGAQVFETRASGVKAKVSKWTKVKEAFRWEKASNGVLPEAKSQDSGLGVAEDVRYLRVPTSHTMSDNSSSFSVSPADSVLSGQSLSQPGGSKPRISSSASTSDDELEDPLTDQGIPVGLCLFRRDVEESRRSKSLDGESHMIPCDLLDSHDIGKDQKLHKGIKNPWSKMKDIIQTRTGSVKKRKGGDSDLEDDSRSGIFLSEESHQDESQFEIENSLLDNPTEYESEMLEKGYDKMLKRRLAPMLTITLSSTEELHSGPEGEGKAVPSEMKVASKPPPSPQTEERNVKPITKLKSNEELVTFKENLHHHGPRKISGGSAGTSPPTPRKLSKWSKVKNAFLTSGSASEDCLHRGSSSVPSSPNKAASFTYDIESDELSSGEFMEDNPRDDDVFPDPSEEACELPRNHNIQAEIQRNYEELQLKLSQEFHKKLCEWERKKNACSPGTPPCSSKLAGSGFSSGTSSIGDDSPHDKGFRKKMEEWEKIKSSNSGAKHRESITLTHLGEENLSADFKKKLEEWEKIKSVPSPQTPDIVNSSQPHFKKKITDWQLWKPGVMTSKSDAGIAGMSSPPADLPEDFYRKLQEWERLKHGSTSSETAGNKTPSPNTSRRDCSENKPGKSQHSPTAKKERDFGFQIRVQKSKSHHEVKELAWLEKELHKIEREKQRLERERDKYLEREARLEKLRKAIGANMKKQEILIPTSTGLFRFEGISQKFTRKLYEWEKAKGIGPEASTFALLDPGYQPPATSSSILPEGLVTNGSFLTRSKSMGSVVDIAALVGNHNTLSHQPSSLSLNHMEQLENNQLARALRDSDELCGAHGYEEEPQAVIVDIVDEIEETASPLEHTPAVKSQMPVYCYAPTEVTRLIDSSGSDSDKDVIHHDGVLIQAQSSIELLQENMCLLDKLQKTEHICREIENKIEDVEEKLTTTERIHKEHLGTLVNKDEHSESPSQNEQSLDEIKDKLLELESQQERLLEEGVSLQHCFVEHSEQQALIAQDLVGKVKQLQVNIRPSSAQTQQPETDEQTGQSDSLTQVQELTSQLLGLAEKLEQGVQERNQEISLLRKALASHSRGPGLQKLRASQHWFSTDSVTSLGVTDTFVSQNSEDLTKIPVLLTNKLQELKKCLGALSPETESKEKPEFLRRKPLNIIEPESPEVEATFVFNISKRSPKISPVAVDGEESLSEEYNKKTEEDTPETKSIENSVLIPTTVLAMSRQEVNKVDSLWEKSITPTKESLEKVVEFTYPLKTYFRQDSKENRTKASSGLHSSESNDSECEENTSPTLLSPTDKLEDGIESTTVTTIVKKHKRTRHSSGHMERRRSKTEVKDENSEEEIVNTGLFEACSGKKPESRYKKVSKHKHKIEDNNDGKKYKKENFETVCDQNSLESVGKLSDPNPKPLTSPKCIPRRKIKNSKSNKEEKSDSENKCLSYNYCCNAQNEESQLSQEMTVNVFVPTTRKIFSPVRKDSRGEASSVISYVVEEPVSSNSQTEEQDNLKEEENSNTSQGIKKNYNCSMNSDKTNNTNNETGNENVVVEKNQLKFDFIMPPCWIIKQARAQSASPALQRRAVHKSWGKETTSENDNSDKPSVVKAKYENADSKHELSEEVSKSGSFEVPEINEKENSVQLNSNQESVPSDTDKKEPVECNNKTSSSSESVENNRPLKKETTSIPSTLKLRSEAGFPPISPLTVRREMKVMKETAPSIRMMIAKYNQKVHESQELPGTKSPESGTQSPIAWRSPVSERRIKAQMNKYQDEVSKALAYQSHFNQNFGSTSVLGHVQKSASAGYIRPFDKGFSIESINNKTGTHFEPQTSQYHGILKSSSAGAIKSLSPLPIKRHEINSSSTKLLTSSPSINSSTTKLTCPSTSTSIIYSEPRQQSELLKSTTPCIQQTITKSSNTPSSPRRPPEIERVRVIHILPIPSIFSDEKINSQVDKSPQSMQIRALKLKKAKEEFLSRGCVSNIRDSTESQTSPTTPEASVQNDCLLWTESKTRLSQISCDSESSYENVPDVLVSGKDDCRDHDRALLVKSASAGMINIDSSASARLFNPSSSQENSSKGAISKSKSGILSRFRKARLKKHKEKEPRLDTVSALCRQSLVVDVNKKIEPDRDSLPSTSKSCPASPVLNKKDQASSSWIRNPKKIFRPKQ